MEYMDNNQSGQMMEGANDQTKFDHLEMHFPKRGVLLQSREEDYSAGTVDISMLAPEELEKVERIARGIDVSDVGQIVRYGENAQNNISDFSLSILR